MADEPERTEETHPKEENKAAQVAIERAARLPIQVVNGVATPKTLDEQLQFANWAVTSKLLPYQIDTPSKAWLVMQRGAELGFQGLAAFDFLYPVNGRVRMTPDAVKAKALASGLLEDAKEEVGGIGEHMVARVTLRRRGLPTPIVGEFSVEDAKIAGLWGKTGKDSGKPSGWITYPKRMLLARARGFAYGDAFKDLCGGLQVRELFDLDPGETLGSDAPEVVHAAAQPPLPPTTKDPLFTEPIEAQVVPQAPPEPDKPETPVDAKGRKVLEVDAHGPVIVEKPPASTPTKEEVLQELKTLVAATKGPAKTRRGALKKAVTGPPPCSKCGDPLGERSYDTDNGVVCGGCRP